MKKNLLTAFFVSAGLFAVSQTRTALYEEFTGETCNPCAATNPGLNTLLLNATNAPKVIAIKWQVPIPSSPTPTWSLYKTDQSDIDGRWKSVATGGYGYPESSSTPTANYINSAPNGRMNGEQLNMYGITAASYNHPGNLTAAAISAGQALATPFAMTIVPVYNANYTNAVVSVTVQSSTTFSATGSLVYRLVLVERVVNFATQPGTNGEKDFYDPVRKAYPNIQTGTSLPATWTASQVQTFTVNCPIPSYINDLSQMAFVGFIQDDGNKKIWQAARTSSVGALPNDIKATAVAVTAFSCATSINPSIAVKNQGNNAVTAMTITPSIDGVPQTPFNWTGSIAAGATATVPVGSYAATGGNHSLVLNVTGVSGGDVNMSNNSMSNSFVLVQTYFPAPVTEPFTAATFPPTNWFMVNTDNGAATYSRLGTVGGYGVNTGAVKYDFFNNSTIGDADELFLYPANLSTLTSPVLGFDVAYAQYSNENDQLDVKVSTDCGATWTNIFSQAGSVLATSAPVSPSGFVPSAAQWKTVVLPMTAYASATQVLVKFVATSAYGNNMYLDNINLTQANPTSIKANTTNQVSFDVYPNPTKGEANITITALTAGNANVVVMNALGQVVYNKQVDLNVGVNAIQLDAKEFASGLYSVTVESKNGSMVKKLTVTK